MATYYVRTTGNDSNGGTDPSTDAMLTVQAGVNLLSAGDTLDIGAGTFSSTSTITVDDTRGGTSATAPTVIRGAGPTTILTSSTNSVPIITTDTGTATLFVLRDLKVTHTAGTRGYGMLGAGLNATQSRWTLIDLEFDGCLVGIYDASRFSIDYMLRVTVRNSTSNGVQYVGTNAANANHIDCRFVDNAGSGVFYNVGLNTTSPFIFNRCVFSGNGADGLKYDASTRTTNIVRATNCTFEGNTGDGIDLSIGSSGNIVLDLVDNVFRSNGGYGVVTGALRAVSQVNVNNAYGNNTSGNYSGWFDGDNLITLTADPFTDAANEDWSPNTAAGGGALLRYAGSGGADVGAIQHEASGGGSSGTPAFACFG